MRLTKIVCTIGPACSSPKQLEELAKAGMNVARINLSHGARKDHEKTLKDLQDLNAKGYNVAILFDTRGAEIRTGDVQDPIEVTKGNNYTFAPETIGVEGPDVIHVNYRDFVQDVKETKKILIDNGSLTFSIVSINEDGTVTGCAEQSGSIGSRRHINLPGADIDLPSITEKDWDDIAFAAENGVDFIALSFIRNAEEVQEARDFLKDKNSSIRICTKIETQQAVKNIAEIIRVSDTIMIARGDLGAELPYETLPAVQDEIVILCKERGVPVLVATHMLESMIEHPMPTRAEVTDVAHAVATGADATMLSGETAGGKYPLESVEAMAKIITTTESHLSRFGSDEPIPIQNDDEAQSEAAVRLGQTNHAHALLVFTKTGETALEVAKFRPHVPIITATDTEEVARALQLSYGIQTIVIPFSEPETTIEAALQEAQKRNMIQKGDKVVLVSDTLAKDAVVSSVQVRTV